MAALSSSISGPQSQTLDISPTTKAPHSNRVAWTPAHEARLVLVQAQLSAAQASWSEEQDLWIDEVEALENLRRKYKKAVRKEARGSVRWKGEWWGRKANVFSSGAGEEDSTGEDEAEEEVKMKDPGHMNPRSSFSTLVRHVNTVQHRRASASVGDVSKARHRRSTVSESEASTVLRRRSGIERLQNTIPFGGILRRLSTKTSTPTDTTVSSSSRKSRSVE